MKIFYLPLFILFFLSTQTFSQGETCVTATQINAGTHTADGPASGDGCFNCSPGNAGGIPAVHADWYKFVPTADGVINISTCGAGADTRLWVYSGWCGNLTQVGESDDACDFVPGEPFAAEIKNLSVLNGTEYYFEFDDAWDRTGFEFMLDFFAVTNNIFVAENELCFTQIPVNQLVNSDIPIEVVIGKQGAIDQNDLTVSSDIFNADITGLPVASFNQMNISLSGNGNQTITTGMLPDLPIGNYYIQSVISSSMPDDDSSDNTIISRTFEVTERTFAIDDGVFPGGLGISGPGSIQMGQIMHFPKGDEITSVSFNIQGGSAGDSIRALIYDFDAGGPTNLLHESKYLTTGTTDPQWFEIPFDTPFSVSDDSRYVVALQHLATGVGIDLAVSEEIFKPMTGYIKVISEPWVKLESNNQNGNPFQFAYAIRPNNQAIFTKVKLQVDMRDEDTSAGNVAIKYLINDEPSQTAAMTDIGNGIWEGEFAVPIFGDIRYLFVNNDMDELVPDNCGEAIRGVVYRTLSVRFDEEDLPAVCFSRCGICPIQGCADPAFIICDDFEAYDPGSVTPQSLFWEDWNGTDVGGLVTDEQAFDGSQSLKFTKTDPPIDALLLLNDNTNGRYDLAWKQYVPSGKSAVFNFQHQVSPQHFWGRNFFFDPGGAGEVWLEEKEADFSFPHDEWFDIQFIIDLDNDYAKFILNGAEVYSWRYSEVTDYQGGPDPDITQLSAMNFTASEDSDEWYVDAILFRELISLPGNVCFGAIDVNQYLNGTTPSFSSTNLTSESIDPTDGWDCFDDGQIDQSVWFTFEGDGSEYLITTNACGTFPIFDSQMALYSGSCGDLTPLDCNDDVDAMNLQSELVLETESGVTYYLMVDSKGGAAEDFCIDFTKVIDLPGDICNDAIDVNQYLGGRTPTYSNANLTADPTDPTDGWDCFDDGQIDHSLWFTFEGTGTEYLITSDGCDSFPLFDSQMALYSGSCDDLTPLACNDDLDDVNLQSELVWETESGVTYFLMVDSKGGVPENFCLVFDMSISTNDPNLLQQNVIYPNPATDVLNIELKNASSNEFEVSIFDYLGALKHQESSVVNSKRIDTSDWQSGVYLIRIQLGESTITQKVIIQ